MNLETRICSVQHASARHEFGLVVLIHHSKRKPADEFMLHAPTTNGHWMHSLRYTPFIGLVWCFTRPGSTI